MRHSVSCAQALWCIVAWFAASGSLAAAGASPAIPADIRALEVLPASLQLSGTNRTQQLLVTGVTESGLRWDLTRSCSYVVADSRMATLDGSLVVGKQDGATSLGVAWGELRATVPVSVEGMAAFPPVDFDNDVVPLFAKLRCNSGGCHGKASGQNGFRLSVFGFDAGADYSALVREARGRRVSPAAPSQSLLFLKATGLMPHGGGRRMAPDSPDAEMILHWIGQGMTRGSGSAPRLAGIEIEPSERILALRGSQQILVTATYSDGSRRDVTHAASYTSNADSIAGVDERGLVQTGASPGEAAITVNYMGQVGAARVLVPRPQPPGTYRGLAVANRIDELVGDKLRKLGIVPSERCADHVFFRRLHLDAAGTLPKPEAVLAFVGDTSPDKRRRAIDTFLSSGEFADYWALKWADVLLVNSASLGPRGAFELHRWLREQLAANRPYDAWVRELIAATGNTGRYGPANFYRALRTPPDLTKTVSQAFLGIRLDCAQCHHHPFEKWGQEDFYGLAGYFTGIERRALAGDREFIFSKGHEPARFPLTGREVATRPLAEPPREIEAADPRVELARWLTDPKNPWFARLAANRLWKNYLGRGLVEPEDDLRSTNPASNEPLLDYLAAEVVGRGFDLREVMRLILNSRTYQLSSDSNETNVDDEQNFSHYLVKRLPAEVMLDAISEVTGSPEPFPGVPLGTRSVQLWDNRLPSYFLDTFGRSGRESPCACARSSDPTMTQALHLMNAPEIQAKIASPTGRISRRVAAGAHRDELVRELCLAALGREPGERERAVAGELFANRPRREAAEDFAWTLLNSYEFLFIH